MGRNALRVLMFILLILPMVVMPVAVIAQPQPTLPPGLITETMCVPGHGYPAYRPQDLPFGPFYGLWEHGVHGDIPGMRFHTTISTSGISPVRST